MMRIRGLLVVCLMVAISAMALAADPSADVQHAMAPTGPLRVGVYRGSPSSIIESATVEESKGVGLDLGTALAGRLGVPVRVVVFPANDNLLAALVAGDVDVVFTNASPDRAKVMDFSASFMDVAKSFLVPAGSALTEMADMKRPGLHVGASKGSSTAGELQPLYPNLAIEPVATLKLASEMLAAHRLDAFATNNAILFQMSDGLPGSRVLVGQWGLEHFAAGLPKGRETAMPFLQEFLTQARGDGTVARAIQRAGLRGTIAAD